MKPILIFSHNYIDHNWYEIVQEQLLKLLKSNLYHQATEIHYGVYANNKWELFKFIELVKAHDFDKKIKITIHPFNDGEKQTMILMQDVIKNYPNAYTLYFHTKGITSLENHKDKEGLQYKNIESWRHILEYFNIERWEYCIGELEIEDERDVCGCLWVGENATPPYKNYYAGNFWWGKTRYLNQLPSMRERDNRMGCETWVGSGGCYWINLHLNSGGDIYDEFFDQKHYRKDLAS